MSFVVVGVRCFGGLLGEGGFGARFMRWLALAVAEVGETGAVAALLRRPRPVLRVPPVEKRRRVRARGFAAPAAALAERRRRVYSAYRWLCVSPPRTPKRLSFVRPPSSASAASRQVRRTRQRAQMALAFSVPSVSPGLGKNVSSLMSRQALSSRQSGARWLVLGWARIRTPPPRGRATGSRPAPEAATRGSRSPARPARPGRRCPRTTCRGARTRRRGRRRARRLR